jgi:hypothetical protein
MISLLLLWSIVEVIKILLNISALDNHLCALLATLLENGKRELFDIYKLGGGLRDVGLIRESGKAFA